MVSHPYCVANVPKVDPHTAPQALSGGDVDLDRLLAPLDPHQRHAVTTPSRLVAVIAGAGSGKTRVLISRILYRVATGDAEPRHTLALTFTREAAGEMRRRLTASGLRDRVEVGTFHAVLLGVLRQHWSDRGRAIPTVVSDRSRLLREALGGERVDELLPEVDWATARGLGPDSYLSAARAAGRRTTHLSSRVPAALQALHDLKRRRGIIDLDDVLGITDELLARDPLFAEAIRWRFRHILIDEAQDLNPIQHRLVDHLRAGSDDLFLVGDPAQAIYGFNGADPSLLEEVGHRFPGVEVVRLTTNHRCTPQVVRTGVAVLTASGQQPTAHESSRPDGPQIEIRATTDEDSEAGDLVTALRQVEPGVLRAGQVAVLARTHAQIAHLRGIFARSGIPLSSRPDGPGSPLREPLDIAGRLGSAVRLRSWAHDVLDDPDTRQSPEPVRVVAACVLEFLREHPMGDGLGFRTWFATSDPLRHEREVGVELLTFHAAKGREWHTVFVTGVETGLVPHRSAATQAARAEEARLLYVAVTRARERVVLTWAQRRGGYRRQISPLLAHVSGEETPHLPSAPPTGLRAATRPSDPTRTLLAQLKEWRALHARAIGVLPEQFCSTALLGIIARCRPHSAAELAQVCGIGTMTASQWYPGLAELLHTPPVAASLTPLGDHKETTHE